MKITLNQLRRIIKEEVSRVVTEEFRIPNAAELTGTDTSDEALWNQYEEMSKEYGGKVPAYDFADAFNLTVDQLRVEVPGFKHMFDIRSGGRFGDDVVVPK